MIDKATRETVIRRAEDRCEYGRLRQIHFPLWLHQIDHIIPKKQLGSDELGNLALSCVRCNLGKSSNLTGIDPQTDEIVTLFHPRIDSWDEHFTYVGAEIAGLTPTGRVTVYVLNMNENQRLRLRYRLLNNLELD